MSTDVKKRPLYKTLLSNAKPKLIISQNVIDEIKYLNSQNENNEWSGVLWYTIEGDVNDVSTLVCTAKAIHLMDIGTSGFTKFKYDSSVMAFLDSKIEELGLDEMETWENWKHGHCHSHHNMSPTPSPTDGEEIEDNIKNHPAYLTLITNNSLKMTAILSTFTSIQVVTLTKSTDFKGQPYEKRYIESFDEGLVKHEVDIEFEKVIVNDSFKNRCADLIEKKKDPLPNIAVYKNGIYSGIYSNHHNTERSFKDVLASVATTAKKPDAFSLLVALLTSTESTNIKINKSTNIKINKHSLADILIYMNKKKDLDSYIKTIKANFLNKDYDDVEAIELLKMFIKLLQPLPVSKLRTRFINLFGTIAEGIEKNIANDIVNIH